MNFSFIVIDKQTRREVNIGEIVKEDWASNLMRHDIESFAIMENGDFALLDECGNWAYCPSDRFAVVFEGERDLCKKAGDKIKEIISLHKENVELREQLIKITKFALAICDEDSCAGDESVGLLKCEMWEGEEDEQGCIYCYCELKRLLAELKGE